MKDVSHKVHPGQILYQIWKEDCLRKIICWNNGGGSTGKKETILLFEVNTKTADKLGKHLMAL